MELNDEADGVSADTTGPGHWLQLALNSELEFSALNMEELHVVHEALAQRLPDLHASLQIRTVERLIQGRLRRETEILRAVAEQAMETDVWPVRATKAARMRLQAIHADNSARHARYVLEVLNEPSEPEIQE